MLHAKVGQQPLWLVGAPDSDNDCPVYVLGDESEATFYLNETVPDSVFPRAWLTVMTSGGTAILAGSFPGTFHG
jgi:hypothetical protein